MGVTKMGVAKLAAGSILSALPVLFGRLIVASHKKLSVSLCYRPVASVPACSLSVAATGI